MSFNIGLSGIRAASTDLEVTGNNVANASTTGFKESRAEFGDVYTSTLLGTGSQPVGSGVMVENVRQEFSQGNISGTENALDMAIDGNGFFILDDSGETTYTRAGAFGLDSDGFVVTSSGAFLQGFEANTEGVVNGVLGNLQVLEGNQAPALTSQVSAVLNLDAGEEVLQEQGLELVSNGLSIGVADSGIIESTTSTLSSVGQPTTEGTAAYIDWTAGGTTLAAIGTAGTAAVAEIQIDIGDGITYSNVSVPAITAGSSEAEVLTSIQTAINAIFGSQELTASASSTGELVISRAGINASNGSTFTTTDVSFDAVFGTNGGVQSGVAGTELFVGTSALTADFLSVPGTSTTTRTTSTPTLSMVASDAGEVHELTAESAYSPVDVSTANGNALAFTIATEGGATTYGIVINEAAWTGTAPVDYASITTDEMVAEINAQITATAGAGNEETFAVNDSGNISFQAQVAAAGEYVQIADNTTTSVGYDLTDLGFSSSNRYDTGVEPVYANNEFNLEVTSTSGNGGGPYQITIPEDTYASLDDVAVAIQQQIDIYIGASGLNGKVTVAAVGGQLVFTNTNTGAGEGISVTGTTLEPQAVTALGFDSMFAVTGQDEIDKTNSFRINLTVPSPDSENRSGSVLISLDEEFLSVQQLATAINRELNSQDSDDYIGIRAQTTEIVPNVVPAEYMLELVAVEEGEASIISISDITASGDDVTSAELFALLQVDPSDGTLLTTGIEGVNNQYPEQTVTLTDPDGNETELTIPEGSEANAIASLFNEQPGVTATASTEITIPVSSYNNPTNSMTLSVNGQDLESTSLAEIADEINGYSSTTLPGFSATIDDSGDLVITNSIGRNVTVEISSSTVTDSIVVQGADDTGPVVLGGSSTAASAAAVGGSITFTFNEGYAMETPVPAVSGLFDSLTEDEFTDIVLNSFDSLDQNTYNHSTSTTIYDSLGNAHVMTQFFVKEPLDASRPTEENIWAMYVQVDGEGVGDPDATLDFPENLEVTEARFELFFNQDGTLDESATGDIYITNWDPIDDNGDSTGSLTSVNVLEGGLPLTSPATNSNFQISLDGSTQFADSFSVSTVSQDGYASGRLAGLEVDGEGVIFARYTNGQAEVLGQVALANFSNPEGLTPLGGTAWGESFDSGDPTVGSPQSGSFGQLVASALEDSNVDISEELVGLIIAQRNFQASAKTIETIDQITQTILNI
jgi:flagellar hook protein FlgE